VTKKKEDFKAFKASDAQKTPIQPKRPKKEQVEEAVSAGFPTIERLLEQEQLDFSGLEERMDALRQLRDEGGAKEKGAARKAITAYERSQDLLEFLWETKKGLGGEAEGG
jgi:hypothetical protein